MKKFDSNYIYGDDYYKYCYDKRQTIVAIKNMEKKEQSNNVKIESKN